MPDQLFFDIVKMVVALACMVGLIYGVVWLLKRFLPGAVRAPGQRVDLSVLSQLNLGSRQRILVIRVADRTLVVGVTEASMTALAELSTPKPEAQKEADDPKIFADLLSWRKDHPAAAAVVPPAVPAARAAGKAAAPADDLGEGPRLFAPGERPAR